MVKAVQHITPHFSHPVRQISLMLIVLGLCIFGAFVALPRVLPVFEANPYLNGFIVFVFFIGVLSCFWNVYQLVPSVRWIEGFAAQLETSQKEAPLLLASLASLIGTRNAPRHLSASSTRSILDSVATRIDEHREITRYIINLLIFLGLLGTFYGLATTVPAVVDTIRSLAPREGEEGVEVFNRLMSGLEAQLGGMGVAFASSLLGLAGSLVVGLLELFSGHGQNRFYRELEEWLSSITRVGLGEVGEGDGSASAEVLELALERFGTHLDDLGEVLAQIGQSQMATDARLAQIASRLENTANGGDGQGAVAALERVAAGQERLISVLENRTEGEGLDAESRMRLRSIDVQMLALVEELSDGRQDMLDQLRTDISTLAAALGLQRGRARELKAPSGEPPSQGEL